MSDDEEDALPAWSEPFTGEDLSGLARRVRLDAVDRDWAFSGATGRGVTVAIIDSGLERDHPALMGRVVESVAVEMVDGEPNLVARRQGRPVRSWHRLRRHRAGLRARGRAGVCACPRRRPQGQGRGLPGRPRVGHRARRAGRQPEPLLAQRAALPVLPPGRRRRLLQQRQPRQRRQQRGRGQLPVVVLVRLLGGGPCRPRSLALVPESQAAGRVRGVGRGRAHRLEGRRLDGRHRQQLCCAADRGAGRAHLLEAPPA